MDRRSAAVLASAASPSRSTASRSPIASTSRRRGTGARRSAASCVAVAIGTLIGVALTILVKGYSLDYVHRAAAQASCCNLVTGVLQRPVRQPVLLLKFRETRAARGAAQGRGRAAPAVEAGDRGRAEADAGAGRAALPVQHARLGAVPDRDRPAAGERACSAISSSTCAPRCRSCARSRRRSARRSSSPRPISTSCACAWARASTSRSTCPPQLRTHPFPPNLLISLVENAIKHGIEPSRGRRHGRALRARQRGRSPGRHGGRHRPRLVGTIARRAAASASPTCASGWRRCTARAAGSRSSRRRRAARGRRSRSRSSRGDWRSARRRRACAMPTALIAEDEPMLRAPAARRASREAWPELAIVAEAEQWRGGARRSSRSSGPTSCSSTSGCRCSPASTSRRDSRRRCHVVFVTAYDEYAVAAFDEGAVDYVLKPPTPERIAKVVARLQGSASARRRSTSRRCSRGSPRASARPGRSSGSARRSAPR